MAHVGKNYRLHFRRDLALGITNNRLAFPREVTLNFQAVRPLHFPFPYNTGPRPSNLLTLEDEWPIVWRTEDVTQHGHTFKLQFRLDILDLNLQETRGVFQILGNDALRLQGIIAPIPLVGGHFAYNAWRPKAEGFSHVDYDEEWWGEPLQSFGLNVVAVPW